MFGDVGLVSVLVRQCRVSVGTCSVRSGYCRDVFGADCFVPGRVRRSQVNVGTSSAMSA